MYMRRCIYGAGGVAEERERGERERKQHVYKERERGSSMYIRRCIYGAGGVAEERE